MKNKTVTFDIQIPDANGERAEKVVTIDVPVIWDEMIEEWVLTEAAHEMIDRRKAVEMGLLSPEQLRSLREKHGLSQKQMGELFQVGEKSWCRWESGKHRPTRSINLLIRALYDGEISIQYLRERAGLAPDETNSTTSMKNWFMEFRRHLENHPIPQRQTTLNKSRLEVDFLSLGGRNPQHPFYRTAMPLSANQNFELTRAS